MLKLTKREIRGMAFGLLLYPVVIFICLFFANMHVLAVSLVVFELFKILVQEIILHKYADFSTRKAAGQKSILIITGGFVLLAYGWYFSIL